MRCNERTFALKELARAAELRLKTYLTTPIDDRGRAFYIAPPLGRRLILSDVHGCYQTFSKLLDKISLTPSDQLFIAGDMINRGPHSMLVLVRIWQLLADGYQVLPLRGNHEQLLLEYNREQSQKLSFFAERQYSRHMIEANGDLQSDIDHFIGMLPYYYETDKELIVHAGFDTTQKTPLTMWKDMMWLREFTYDERTFQGKRIFHGHVPQSFAVIEACAKRGARVVCVDNACVRAKFPGYGNLVCMNLDTGEIIKKKNCDLLPLA